MATKPVSSRSIRSLGEHYSQRLVTTTEAEAPPIEQRPRLRLSPQELLQYDSGLLIFRLMDAALPRKRIQLEVCFDEYMFPAHSFSMSRARSQIFEETSDFFVRELDFSKMTWKARASDSPKEEVLASKSVRTINLLKQSLVSDAGGSFLVACG